MDGPAEAPEDALDLVFRQRLLVKETYLKRAMKKFLQLSKHAQNGDNEECEYAKNELLKELEMFEFTSINKPRLISEANERQVENYIEMQRRRELEIAEVSKEILRLKELYAQEKQNRKNKEEYSAAAEEVNKFPSRDESEREIDQLNKEIASLNEDSTYLSGRINHFLSQWDLFTCSLRLFEQSLEEPAVPTKQEPQEDTIMTEAEGEEGEQVVEEVVGTKEEDEDEEEDDTRKRHDKSVEEKPKIVKQEEEEGEEHIENDVESGTVVQSIVDADGTTVDIEAMDSETT